MAKVAIVGGGAAGLTAGLFTAKNGLETVVFDTDDTWLHSAHLFNYPGIESLDGTRYLEILRTQVDRFGVDRRQGVAVESVERDDDGYVLETDDGSDEATYVVLATGANRDLAESAGCAFDGDVVDVDVTMETSLDGLYATGAMVRKEEWQTVISSGDGAAAALNILSRERGDHFHDFDTPGDADEAFSAVTDSE